MEGSLRDLTCIVEKCLYIFVLLRQHVRVCYITEITLNLLRTKRRTLYLKTQSVPRCKHFSSRL